MATLVCSAGARNTLGPKSHVCHQLSHKLSNFSKLYSSMLNCRLQKYLEKNNILAEEQNGFRASRSCIEHIIVLCSVLRNKKALGLTTFLSFIDFQKAFWLSWQISAFLQTFKAWSFWKFLQCTGSNVL